MHSTLLATLVAILWGVTAVFWTITLRKMSGGSLFVILGTSYLVVGITLRAFTAVERSHDGGLHWALLTSVCYIAAAIGCNYLFGNPRVNLPIVTAITGAYPLITAILAAFMMKQVPTPKEIFFILMTTGGIVGLSLSSSKQ